MNFKIYLGIACAMGLAAFSMPEAAASSRDVLQKIEERTLASDSDIVMIVKDGDPMALFGKASRFKPIESRSITKSFVGLAIGLLIDEGKIGTSDLAVSTFYPSFSQGMRGCVTIAELLSHTSGLECGVNLNEPQKSPDIIFTALNAPFISCPGTRFQYNNNAVNLLAGIVKKASGKCVQNYLRHKLFEPLGITSDSWLFDPCGNQFGMAHLTMSAVDLAKIGILIAGQGCWNGNRLISSSWLKAMMCPSQEINPFYSTLWWLSYRQISFYWDDPLLALYTECGLDKRCIDVLRSLKGQKLLLQGNVNYRNYAQHLGNQLREAFGCKENVINFFASVDSLGLPMARCVYGDVHAISARGYLGQQLIVMPEASLVAIRLTSKAAFKPGESDTFADLECLLVELAKELEKDPTIHPIIRCAEETREKLPPAYNCESDPEFRRPTYPGTLRQFPDPASLPYYQPS